MRAALICMLLCLSNGIVAQSMLTDSTKYKKFEYFFQFHSGALVGCSSCSDGKSISYSAGFTNGINIGKRLHAGAGFGIDSYERLNVLPVYLAASWDLLGRKNTLFVQASYGDAIGGWKTQSFNEYGHADSKYGKMYSYYIGYRIKYEQLRISVGVGRKTQIVREYYEYPTYHWISNTQFVPGDPSTKELKTQLNRLAIYLAIGWK